MWPVITVKEDGAERRYDMPSRLLKDRIVLCAEEINPETSASIVAQLLALESEDDTKPVTMYINSPGGSVYDGFAIYDVMQNLRCPVVTICVGMAASMGAFLLAAGAKGKRYAMPNSTVMIHQPLGGVQGQASEIEIHAKHILRLKKSLYDILAKATGQDYAKIESACDRDTFLSPAEAKAFGLIDHIIGEEDEAGQEDTK